MDRGRGAQGDAGLHAPGGGGYAGRVVSGVPQ